MTDFQTMKENGRRFGITSHQVGRILKAAGLRTQTGKPSRKAFVEEWVQETWTSDRLNYTWAWDTEKTAALLESNGLRRVAAD